ncbi:hypothetical protein Halhy_4830 [Haliscomenobacter hydrossis DSM 1100]|uniref:Uncharacterized protein n=1 Tax=Haliscomenobacter hydrossis (strain ATCC 27775 / DSM 1100 / LMG 10767 / O) TaxID=760192 RepID=F4KYX6_HALH1|nr:hypothetical protein Halhy_4830 [Haliscomenobacter hydrossis DSM 1100]
MNRKKTQVYHFFLIVKQNTDQINNLSNRKILFLLHEKTSLLK